MSKKAQTGTLLWQYMIVVIFIILGLFLMSGYYNIYFFFIAACSFIAVIYRYSLLIKIFKQQGLFFILLGLNILLLANGKDWSEGSMKSSFYYIPALGELTDTLYSWLLFSAFLLCIPLLLYMAFLYAISSIVYHDYLDSLEKDETE